MSRRTTHSATNVMLVTQYGERIKGRVLDVGCGSKPFKRLFYSFGKYREGIEEWVGVDIRPVAELVADASELPVDDASFDTVLCTDVLQYVADPAKAMREFHRVLKPGGTLILTCPNTAAEDDIAFWNIKANGLSLLCEQSGLKAIDIQAGGQMFTSEFNHYRTMQKYGVGIPEGFSGFIGMLEEMYPFFNVLVAEKE